MHIAAADPALTDAAGDITTYLTDNLPTVIGVTVAFVSASIVLGFVRGLRRNKV